MGVLQLLSDVHTLPLARPAAPGSHLGLMSFLRLALAGLGLAAGCFALSLIIGSGPTSAQTPASPPLPFK